MTYRLIVKSLDAEDEIEAEGIADFAAILLAYRANNDLSASEWIGCEVYAEDGALIKRLAYNGAEIE